MNPKNPRSSLENAGFCFSARQTLQPQQKAVGARLLCYPRQLNNCFGIIFKISRQVAPIPDGRPGCQENGIP
jgi:hypothetical protein